MTCRQLRMTGLALGLGVASLADAASLGTYSVVPTRIDGRVIPGFYPDIELDLVYDDNVLRTESGQVDDFIAVLKPNFQWVTAAGKHMLRFAYDGRIVQYADEGDENYDDHFLGADATLDLTTKLDVNFGAAYRFGHESRGASGVINSGVRPNRWEESSARAEVLYGRRIARAQVGGRVEYSDRNYTNNGQSFRDATSVGYTLTGFYNLGARTQLLVEPSYTEIDYPNANQDNTVYRVLAGVTWDATAKTTGVVKVGYHDKVFDSPVFGDTSGLAIDADVIWSPKTYSVFTFGLSRDVNDSNVAGAGAYESISGSVDWTHEFSNLVKFEAGLVLSSDDYNGVSRTDDRYLGYIGVEYPVKRWLNVGVEYRREERDSNVVNNDFVSNSILLRLSSDLN